MKIAFVVCGNGYGHLKRVCAVVTEIFKIQPATQVRVIGAGSQEAMLREWDYHRAFQPYDFAWSNARLENNLTATVNEVYTVEAYHASFNPVWDILKAYKPDRVVSDNLVGILVRYPRAILMGSFLWPDTLTGKYPDNPVVREIAAFERDLLDKHNPVMIGVEDMAMPFVKARTRFKGLPWFCDPDPERNFYPGSNRILITGGGTANAQQQLLEVARTIMDSGRFQVMLDKSLYARLDANEKKTFGVFDFSDQGFRSLAWIICRPGIGILTEAVQYAIPVCVVNERDPEMVFNASRVEALGMGINAPRSLESLHTQLTQEVHTACVEQLRKLKTGGTRQAADCILNA